MKIKLLPMVVALAILPSLCFAAESAQNDTVKVIDNPSVVVDSVKDSRFQVFMSDIYVGFGGLSREKMDRDVIKGSSMEVGVLNLASFGYNFNKERSRLSFGVGLNYANYGLRAPYFWNRSGNGALGYVASPGDYDNHSATLSMWSMQFPLMYNHSLGKKWSIAAAAVMKWNCYANISNSYSVDKSDYNVTTHGLNQRKITFDYVGMLSWHGVGFYFRYAPQSLFKTGMGPEMKNRWTVGITLRGL